MLSPYPDFTEYQYRVQRELGRNREGGRISYLAQRLDHRDELVVIKQFRFVQTDANWQGFKAYEREIQFLRELDHPRIPRYLDSFETKDGFCMVQEYKTAPTLSDRRTFKPIEIKQIALSVLEILVDLQSRIPPIFHRDIKPENILVDDQHQAYLIDFGLARIDLQEVAVSSMVAGTPGFMAPEELFNRPLTKGSDLYSLGATIICLITNTRSIDINNLLDDNYQLKFNHLVTGINPLFIKWLQKMVASNPRDRFPDASAAQQKLGSIDIENTHDLNPDLDLDPIDIARIDKWTQQRVSANSDDRFLDQNIAEPRLASIEIEKIYDTNAALDPVDIAKIDAARIVRDNLIKQPKPQIYGLSAFGLFSIIMMIGWPLTSFIRQYSQSQYTFDRADTASRAYPKMKTNIQWFEDIKPRCNAKEVETAMNTTTRYADWEGNAYAATCYALGGKIDEASELITPFKPEERTKAVNIIFELGQTVADAGDDKSVGSVMELVLIHAPRNHMAMYQAGISAYALGDLPLAKQRLTKFLKIYKNQDGWTNEARIVLKKIEQDISKNIKSKRP
jgi:serine/threonine protein kinase